VGERPLRRVPLHVSDDRLLGGLDLAATLQAGRPVSARGLLADADGGLVLLSMAERVERGTAARIAAVLDSGRLDPERDFAAAGLAARFGVIAFDESGADEDRPAGCLMERLALRVDLDPIGRRDTFDAGWTVDQVVSAQARLGSVTTDGESLEALCGAAVALGIDSLRTPSLALRVARAHAALAGRSAIAEEDIACAARLVLAPRATRMPAAEPETDEEEATEPSEAEPEAPEQSHGEEDSDAPAGEAGEEEETPEPPRPPEGQGDEEHERAGDDEQPLAEVVLEAARAVIPEGLLDSSHLARAGGARASAGKSGAQFQGGRRGRPAGVRRGEPGPMARLNVIETLRSAAPWQTVRRRERGERAQGPVQGPLIDVRHDDLRVTRFKARRETATLFAVDASGSSALHRLSEAKGAVELLLADCYVRRDQVALVSFRGKGAEVLLPPTRSLVRAKRLLGDLPGGGGTPLAAGIDAVTRLADRVARDGMTPMVVLLTDGRGNVALDGSHDRAAAEHDALAAGRQLRAAGIAALLVDTSPRPRREAIQLAEAMGARHLPLPHGDAASLSAAVKREAA
jgi:magnesium chelatase subunit D